MALPAFSMRELIEAGVHYGHKTKRWNPRMASYIYGVRNDIHIIDLQKTVPLLHRALQTVRSIVAENGRVLFVGTKSQAQEIISEAAKRCGQYYVNQRWLGGMLTNWNTIQNSIKTLRNIEESLEQGESGLTKKEMLTQSREKDKLDKSLGGIKDMAGLPDLIVIIDTNKEKIAVQEANKLGIPIIAVLDSNSSPEGISFPIPGNDDATKSIQLYCRLFSDAALDGLQEAMAKSGVDFGAAADLNASEELPEEARKDDDDDRKKGKGPVVVNKKKSPTAKAKELQAEEAVAEPEAEGDADAKKAAPKAAPKAKKEGAAKKPAAKKKA